MKSSVRKAVLNGSVVGRPQVLGDFYLSVLRSTASKREARSYLSRFTPSVSLPYLGRPAKPTPRVDSTPRPERHERQLPAVPNLSGNILPTPSILSDEEPETIHLALVKIRDLSSITEHTLHGVGRTLGQLQRLGLSIAVVLDDPPTSDWHSPDATNRILKAIETYGGKARIVDGALANHGSDVSVSIPQLILAPLERGVIPILAPTAYNETLKLVYTDANDIVDALVSIIPSGKISLDRLLFLDPAGGIPAPDRPNGAHVFVNIQQEFGSISAALEKDGHAHHRRALETMRKALAQLPPTSSGLITTPIAAAATTKTRNPLIHNLLTDKPAFSSSLPTATSPLTQTTLLKHGTPLKIFPSGTNLSDPSIDLPKLVALIEDSFGKRLDVEHYLKRVDKHIAGLIIAGDYDGAAIVTWEYPQSGGDRVCYLDKFAVARRAQGQGGVADVVFKAMVCLFEDTEGIVWRSRRENVVNKWYFERARGTWKIPKQPNDHVEWTMFWTTSNVETSLKRMKEYEEVCKTIEPSLREVLRR
ncbi:hypothetical protein BZA77DRAFT_379000 [Pyronema omphalodes]|nr:hypothetical protein BZA77DRAFT_379000 [Pyronema omphalodes]